MRRKNREITDKEKILKIMRNCDVCSLALFDEEFPYVIPLNFGLSQENDSLILYFHCAHLGKKLDLIKKNNRAGFEMNCAHKLITGEKACNTTMEYKSVCGNGFIEVVSEAEKEIGLCCLMEQYCGNGTYEFMTEAVNSVTILKLKVNQIFGKAPQKSKTSAPVSLNQSLI